MDQWLDSLSEDWISQPRSSHSNSALQTPPSNSSRENNVSQSRIPRYIPRSVSNGGAPVAKMVERRSSYTADTKKSALNESSSSNINASQRRALNGTAKIGSPSSESRKNCRRHPSKGSLPSARQDTVQHQPSRRSPLKEGWSPQSTPEWKRRVLQGDIGSRPQCDLFSPIGLEKVFKPPIPGSRTNLRRGAKANTAVPKAQPLSSPYPPSGKMTPPTGSTEKAQSSVSSLAKLPDDTEGQYDTANAPTDSEISLETKAKEQTHTRARTEFESSSTSTTSQQSAECISQRGSHMSPSSKSGTLLHEAVQTSVPFSPRAESAPSIHEAPAPIENSGNISIQDQDFENLSPFHVSRHHTGGGRIDYVAVDMSMYQPRTQMDEVLVEQQHRLFSSPSDDDADPTVAKSSEENLLVDIENKDWTSHSLPEGLSAGTDVFAANGGFVNTRRGGYSNDGSFQRRPLSPSSFPSFDISRSKSSTSFSGSVVRDTKIKAPPQIMPAEHLPLPRTPEKQRDKNSSHERTRSSGSPLKLFDKYDTFTNDRLSRRMSKFEEAMHQDENRAQSRRGHWTTPKDSMSQPGQPPKQQSSRRSQQRGNVRLCSFGDGDLDGHSFTCKRLSMSSHPSEVDEDRKSSTTEVVHRIFTFEPGLKFNSPYRKSAKRHLSSSSAPFGVNSAGGEDDPQGSVRTMINLTKLEKMDEMEETLRNAQGKRISHSPGKNPQPKRRRTIYRPEVDHEISLVNTAIEVQPVVGRKRKDALYDGQSQAADPKILAMRQMLRPRSSTYSQNGSQNRTAPEGGPIEVTENNSHSIKTFRSPQLEDTEVDRPTEELADELANFTLGMVQNMANGSRKASVTTADFFNEAQQIMKLIRAERLPQSSPEIAEESEADSGENGDFLAEDSTRDEFSRPPSRDGVTSRKQREPAPVDPKVIGLLRQFEDQEDLGITLPSSLKSLHIKKPNQDAASTGDSERNILESDPPNVRILERKHSDKVSTSGTKVHSYGSHGTSDPSTGRSLQGASSSGSRNKMVIAPATVSHLLSDQMAGMVFDREKQVWVKQKITLKGGDLDVENCAGSETTDRDLLGEIPDLIVDELEEMQRVKEAAASFKRMGSNSDGISRLHYPKACESQEAECCRVEESQDNRPRTVQGAHLPGNEDSSVQSKVSRFASSGPVPETRTTSWADEELQQTRSVVEVANSPTSSIDRYEQHDEEVEHEIKILEGRESRAPVRSNKRDRQPRVVTVAFSSPLVDQTQTPYTHNRGPESWDDEGDLIDDLDDSPIRFDSRPDPSTMKSHSARSCRRSIYRSASRRVSLENRSYIARPMSRLDEQDEISFLQCTAGGPNVSLEVVLSTPLTLNRGNLGPRLPSTGQRSSVGFHLSPLADFTVHQTDASHLGRHDRANRRGLLALHEVEGGLSLATQNLVKRLTDIEPYEPYWDFIRTINLQKRGLTSLCMLDEYCPSIEELDVSDNTLAQLDGAPSSIRDLKICRNQLSDLTAWAHLRNLQYLDVSYNQIHNLRGFQGLVHLRELIADGNQIESLDGVLTHDGLISLSLRGNRVRMVDFEETNLKRLTHLNVCGNGLITIAGLHHLAALEYLDLSRFQSPLINEVVEEADNVSGDNQLEDLESSPIPLFVLKNLSVSNNHLITFDVTSMPNLQSLNLDQNSTSHIEGLNTLKKLDILSWRGQTLSSDPEFPGPQYQDCQNVQTLYLSSNVLSSFLAPAPFLDLHNLALASTGLKTLCPDFGHMLPNLRVLNLNYNALRDLRPLLGIVKLQKLFVAGNRISRLRQTAAVLEDLGDELVEVDLRRNPLTVGFYTPQESRSSSASVPLGRQMVVQQGRSPDHYQQMEGYSNETTGSNMKIDLLPPVDPEADTIARARLDKDTSLRRRVYEILVVNACSVLEVLDGMELDLQEAGRKDEVSDRLMQLGVLVGVGDDARCGKGGEKAAEELRRSKVRRRRRKEDERK